MPTYVLVLERLRQEDCEFEASLGHKVRPCLKKKKAEVLYLCKGKEL
jgi:hypothetical protein